MKIWKPTPTPKPPCHRNGYLQTASDARAHRNRFRRNPWAKVGSLFVPRLLRMSPGYPCCCGGIGECTVCVEGTVPDSYSVTFAGIIDGDSEICGDNCSEGVCLGYNGTFVLDYVLDCLFTYETPGNCPEAYESPYTQKIVLNITAVVGMNVYYWNTTEIYHAYSRWTKAFPGAADCDVTDFALDRAETDTCPCDTTAATCHVTAL